MSTIAEMGGYPSASLVAVTPKSTPQQASAGSQAAVDSVADLVSSMNSASAQDAHSSSKGTQLVGNSTALVAQLRQQVLTPPSESVATRQPDEVVRVPERPEVQRHEVRIEHEPERMPVQMSHPQVGYQHTTRPEAGQYAAIYNSTAVALSRSSLAPMATEHPRLATRA